jgi:hypothetical protein
MAIDTKLDSKKITLEWARTNIKIGVIDARIYQNMETAEDLLAREKLVEHLAQLEAMLEHTA